VFSLISYEPLSCVSDYHSNTELFICMSLVLFLMKHYHLCLITTPTQNCLFICMSYVWLSPHDK